MADQKITDAAITTNLVKTFYKKRMIERLEPQTRLFQLGQKEPIPMGEGNKVEFSGYRSFKPILSNSNELSSTQVRISAYKITSTLIQRHNYVQVSTLLKQTAIDPKVRGAVDAVADLLAKTVEIYLRQSVVGQVGTATRSSITTHGINTTAAQHNTQGVITGTSAQRTHHFWSPFPALANKARLSSSGADIAVMAGSAASLNQFRHAASFLRSKDALPFDGENYIALIHPWVADVVMQDPKWATWNQNQRVRETMMRGEIGNAFGIRFIQSNMAFRYVYSAAPLTTASGAFNASFVTGKDSFAVTQLTAAGANQRGFDIIVKNPGPGSTNDPADLIHTIAGKMVMVASVINKSAGAVVINTDKVVTSAS